MSGVRNPFIYSKFPMEHDQNSYKNASYGSPYNRSSTINTLPWNFESHLNQKNKEFPSPNKYHLASANIQPNYSNPRTPEKYEDYLRQSSTNQDYLYLNQNPPSYFYGDYPGVDKKFSQTQVSQIPSIENQRYSGSQKPVEKYKQRESFAPEMRKERDSIHPSGRPSFMNNMSEAFEQFPPSTESIRDPVNSQIRSQKRPKTIISNIFQLSMRDVQIGTSLGIMSSDRDSKKN
jgi:hypothetical protein